MIAGDTAGLALLSSPYAWIGVVHSEEGATLQMYTSPHRNRRAGPRSARPCLFHYNTFGRPGGYADFDNYTVDEPRARGVEREIPMGKTIMLASGADGSLLAADLASSTLVNFPAGNDAPANTEFAVLDQGLGRVALKANNGKIVSVEGPERVLLKDLGGEKPGDAETFQWVNLMRGDTMLMSLTNHRYLATKPHAPGPVTVTSTGPNPTRKGGACFKWKERISSDRIDERTLP